MCSKSLTSKRGFTLIELVVVIAVLAVLAAIAIPVISHTVESATLSAAQLNADTLESQLRLAKADVDTGNDETYGAVVSNKRLTVGEVVKMQSLSEACEARVYQGREIVPVWDQDTGCVELMYTDDRKNVETGVEIINFIRITEDSRTLVVRLLP